MSTEFRFLRPQVKCAHSLLDNRIRYWSRVWHPALDLNHVFGSQFAGLELVHLLEFVAVKYEIFLQNFITSVYSTRTLLPVKYVKKSSSRSNIR